MAADTDSEMKVCGANNTNANVDNYRRLVQNYLRLVSGGVVKFVASEEVVIFTALVPSRAVLGR